MTSWTPTAGRMGGHALMTCPGHHVEFRCCGVVHYASIEPILVGARIRPENLGRLCSGCPDPAEGAPIRCCVCRTESDHPWSVITLNARSTPDPGPRGSR